jgi:hypothetical protein
MLKATKEKKVEKRSTIEEVILFEYFEQEEQRMKDFIKNH